MREQSGQTAGVQDARTNGHPRENGINPKPQFEPIAIVGMAMRLPGGVRNGDDFWDLMVQKRAGLCTVPEDRYNIKGFHTEEPTAGALRQPLGYFLQDVDLKQLDTSFFSLPKKELARLDPQHRQLLELTWECMESAGATGWRGTDMGCFVGVLGQDWRDLNTKETHQSGNYRVTGFEDSFLSNRLSYEFDLHGPSLTVKTACSSSMSALHLACDAIRLGDCSSALVAGSSLIFSPGMSLAFADQGILSPTGTCKTFDAGADGYARGEALNMIYIKKLSDALKAGDPIRAVIRATAANCDGRGAPSAGITTPSPASQEALIRKTYEAAGISDFSQTAYVECHGTGTQVGDPLEAMAVGSVFGEKGVLITSVKPNVGHSEGAAGITSVIKAVLSLENRTIPPNIFFNKPNPQIPFDKASLRVPVEPEPWPKDRKLRVSVNSFGIGGSNAHVIIEAWEPTENRETPLTLSNGHGHHNGRENFKPLTNGGDDHQSHLLVFSAQNADSLKCTIDNYTYFLNTTSVRLKDVAYTLAVRREALSYRSFAVIDNVSTTLVHVPPEHAGPKPRVVFIFTGQGAQWPQMGKRLLDTNGVFNNTIKQLDQYLQYALPTLGWTIEGELRKPASDSKIHTAEMSQPICTAIQIALVETLRSWGVKPEAVLGHSSGEIAAAYASGALSMKVAMTIASMRGITVRESTQVGGMAAVGLGREELLPFLEEGAVVACENSHRSSTISGDLKVVQLVVARIKTELPDVFVRMLKVERAYHSHHMRAFGATYQQQLTKGKVVSKEPEISHYSSVTECRIRGKDALGPAYWRENLESPVLFNTALRALREDFGNEKVVFVEIGPHPALKGYVEQIVRDLGHADDVHIGTLSRASDCQQVLLSTAGKLFMHNCQDLDLASVVSPGSVLTNLPSYSWTQNNIHWDESRVSKEWRFRSEPPHELLGTRVLELNNEPHWRNMISLDDLPWLEGHQVAGQIVFPAAGYIAMVGEAIRQLSEEGVYSLRQVNIKSALVLTHGTPAEVVTTLSPLFPSSPDSSAWYSFNVSSFNGTNWTTHCSGEARRRYDGLCYPTNAEAAVTTLPRKVDPKSWYDMMDDAGFCYSGFFRGLKNISSSTTGSEALGSTTSAGSQGRPRYTLHPAVIDQCFQMLCISSIQGQTHKYLRLAVPTYIEDIVIFASGDDLQVKATGVASQTGSFSGDVIAQYGGKPSLFMKGLKSSPLESGSIPGQDRNFVTPQDGCTDGFLELESLFTLCAAEYVESIKPTETTPSHLRKLHKWARGEIDRVSKGGKTLVETSHALCDRSERLARIKTIASQAQATRWAPCAIAITRLLDSAPGVFSGGIEPLTVLMEGDLLSRIYDILDAGDYADTIRSIAHKNPRLRILEVGAGTGAASEKILKALTTSRRRSALAAYANIEYRVFDVSKHPADQGLELASYDLIIGANVIHATSSLHTSLTHLRALLRPTGQLFLQELSPEAKWINFVWGHLPGWWLGEEDGRPDSPWVSPQRWTEEYMAADFQAPHTIVYDYPPPFHINASIIARVASKTQPASTATLLCNDEEEPHVQAMKTKLEAGGVDVTYEGDIICFLDKPAPILYDMPPERFQQIFSHLLAARGNIFWVTGLAQIDCQDPRNGMVLGLARSLRQEENKKMYTIEMDDKTSLDTAIQHIAAIQKVSHSEATLDDMDVDWEYAIVDGLVYIPRMHWQTRAGTLTEQATDEQTAATLKTQSLAIGSPGLLHTMHWEEEPVADLQEDEVRIRVKSVAMNFKDVLIAMAIVNADLGEIGRDVAGVVVARGSAITDLEIGDRVISLYPGCFTTYKNLPASHCVKLESNLSFEEGAAIPCVYATAMMCLVDRGNLKKGQTVLIHSACGGVGLAAVQIALSLGAQVFCTVGNAAKVAYLVEELGIPASNIFNSRDDSFAADVMNATDGRGVDLVLNSLAGELLHASWKCVAEFGVMIEIGKRDFQRHAKLSMEIFELNRSFVGLDLGHILLHRPAEALESLQRCMKLLRDGAIKPLPLARVFDALEIQEAFRSMQGGQHIGKMVVNMPDDPETLQAVQTSIDLKFRPDRSYLLVGGLGGLGKVIAGWMVEHGARHLIFLARSGNSQPQTRDFLAELKSLGCETQVFTGSVGSKDDVEAAVRGASLPIAGVMNLSLVLKDVAAANMSFEDWNAVMPPKVQGTLNLHEALPSDLDFFVLFGSYSGIAGQWGQVNYGAANTYVDAFVQYRHSQGLAASVIDLGAVGDAGYVSQNPEVLAYMRNSGTYMLRSWEVLDAVQLAIRRSRPLPIDISSARYTNPSQIIVGVLTGLSISDKRARLPWKRDPRMSYYQNLTSNTDAPDGASTQQDDVRELLAQASSSPEMLAAEETQQLIASALGLTLSNFLLKPSEDMRLDVSLDSIGVDSLVAMELRNWVRQKFAVELKTFEIIHSNSLLALAELVSQALMVRYGTPAS
uniref:Carrier domain-containing protein n=1 Tax=Bionectria ochroleuca TaxID=29856 RepID=A0A8H7K8X3_BIOOC